MRGQEFFAQGKPRSLASNHFINGSLVGSGLRLRNGKVAEQNSEYKW